MKTKCLMCGDPIAQGILCPKCDKPRVTSPGKTPIPHGPAPPPSVPPKTAPSIGGASPARAPQPTAPPKTIDSFPKAPLLPFPVESTSLALTSICEVLTAAKLAAVVLTQDSKVKFVTEEAYKLFSAGVADVEITLETIEDRVGFKLPERDAAFTLQVRISNRSFTFSMIPLSGGVGGSVLIFRPETGDAAHTSFVTYVREAVLFPLRALREAMVAASRNRGSDPLLDDCASTIDQILSSIELAPGVEEIDKPAGRPISRIIKQLAERFTPAAAQKGAKLQIDVPPVDENYRHHRELEAALTTLLENAVHYVPIGGQIALGQRFLEHKGRSLLLFFVMDNGPVVPDELRDEIFAPNFVWKPAAPHRTGRNLSGVREFALAHGGQVWVESKTGKACTFFLRVRRDA